MMESQHLAYDKQSAVDYNSCVILYCSPFFVLVIYKFIWD